MTQALKQLQLLYKIETDKEQELASNLQAAMSFLQANQAKLKEVQGYKVDYLTRMQKMALAGVAGGNYQHYQNFIVQLDSGILAQQQAVDTASQVVEQRRGYWLQQRTKVKAVETLINNKKTKIQQLEDKQEQNMIDELASQKFIRSKFS